MYCVACFFNSEARFALYGDDWLAAESNGVCSLQNHTFVRMHALGLIVHTTTRVTEADRAAADALCAMKCQPPVGFV